MTTKFVSKNSNYMIVLRSGIEGNRALGTHAIPGLYVKFQSGVLDVKDENVIDLLRNHPSFGTDFIEIKEEEVDPYSNTREDIEPGHIIQELKYGHAEKAFGTPLKVKMTPQLTKIIETEAIKMLPNLLKQNPKILKDIILSLASDMKAKEESEETQSDNEETVKRGPGRPPKTE